MQQAFDSYARYYVESFRLPSLSKRAVDRPFTVDGFHHITEALEGGKGCIFALPHLGGWEWAGRWMTDRGHRLTVVVEALDPPELFEWFADLRKDLGMTVVPTGPEAGPAVLRALRANEIVCLLCDRDIERHGVEVEFFGERTTMPGGPAVLALRTGAPILPIAVYFEARGQHPARRGGVQLAVEVRDQLGLERVGRGGVIVAIPHHQRTVGILDHEEQFFDGVGQF